LLLFIAAPSSGYQRSNALRNLHPRNARITSRIYLMIDVHG
jgi:hypothetical protein